MRMRLFSWFVITASLIYHCTLFAQAHDTAIRPHKQVTLQEFKQALRDGSRDIYLRNTSDSLMGPIAKAGPTTFLLRDSTVIVRTGITFITEHRTHSSFGTVIGIFSGMAMGSILGAAWPVSSSGFLSFPDLERIGNTLGGGLVGAVVGGIVGYVIGDEEYGYHFLVDSLGR